MNIAANPIIGRSNRLFKDYQKPSFLVDSIFQSIEHSQVDAVLELKPTVIWFYWRDLELVILDGQQCNTKQYTRCKQLEAIRK